MVAFLEAWTTTKTYLDFTSIFNFNEDTQEETGVESDAYGQQNIVESTSY